MMASMTPFSAVLLAAGRSTRMGRDKALLDIEGIPLWQHQRNLLAATGPVELFLSARPDQGWARTAKGFDGVLHDALPGCGPLVGITAGLERGSQPLLAVLAIDLPQMTRGWFDVLHKESRPGVGVVGRRDGYFEPLAAIYPRELMWLAWESLARCEYSLQQLIARGVEQGLLRVRDISDSEAPRFANWNRAADAAR